MILTVAVMIAVILADQLTKLLIVGNLAEGSSLPAIPGIFRLTYIENKGAAFGMLADHRWVFMVFSAVALIVIFVYLWRKKPQNVLVRLSLAMILGGGVGNMIDRTFRGAVIDFIDLEFMHFYIFNVADAFVCIGCGLLILYLLLAEMQESRKKKTEAAAGETPENAAESEGGTDA